LQPATNPNVGQVGNLRPIVNRPAAAVNSPYSGVDNAAQLAKLPHNSGKDSQV
jgi:hypothetical protein